MCWADLLCGFISMSDSFDELEFLILVESHWSLFSYMVGAFWLQFEKSLPVPRSGSCSPLPFKRALEMTLFSQVYFQDPVSEKYVMSGSFRKAFKSTCSLFTTSVYRHLKSSGRTYRGTLAGHVDAMLGTTHPDLQATQPAGGSSCSNQEPRSWQIPSQAARAQNAHASSFHVFRMPPCQVLC